MRISMPKGPLPGFGLAPMFLGVVLFLAGLLIWLIPNLLEYVVAGAFMALGFMLVVGGWTARRGGVSYRRIDRTDGWDE